MVIFLVASLLLVATMATPSILNQGRREKEAELVWRGNQYVRAVRLYYQKNGRYPPTLEDLAKGGVGEIHFLRKAYADPANAADGAWRVIYVAPSGQLIGSVHYHTLQEMALMLGINLQTTGASAASGAATPGGQQAGTQQPGQQSASSSGQQAGAQPGQTGQTLQIGQPQGASSTQAAPVGPLQAVDGPVFGGSVIGVASKVKQPSLIVYQGGKTYFDWEFIWNPLMTAAGAGQAPGPQPAPGTQPAANPNGATFPPGALGTGNPLANPPVTSPLTSTPPPQDIPVIP